MAGVTTHCALSVEAALVQIKDHLDHTARSLLGRLVVLIEAVGGVAVIAAHAEGAGNESHGRIQLRCGKCFEDLNLLEQLLGRLRVGSGNNDGDEKDESE